MNITITALNIEATPALRDYIQKRLSSLSKFTQGEPTITVEIGMSSGHHKQGDIFEAKVNVITPLGKQYIARAEKPDMYEAIDNVRSEIVRELSSAKDKNTTLFRRGAQKIKKIIRGFRN